MRKLVPAAALLLVLVSAACGSGEPRAVGGSTGADDAPPPAVPAPDPEQLYEADATVLEQDDVGGFRPHGPELCLGGVDESWPPQCGGVPIVNWDWAAVDGEESEGGGTWGDFHVTGTYDGETFTVTQVGPADFAEGDDGSAFTTSCPEPPGGWAAVDPGATEADFDAGAAVAAARPDYVALWVDYAGDLTADEIADLYSEGKPVVQIMNVVVTGDPAATEAAIRKVWRGPLCVVQHEGPTEAEAQAIRAEAEKFIMEELGLEFLWSSEGDAGEAAEVGVVIDVDGVGQAMLDERYGPGVVRLAPALTPVAE